MLQGNRSQLAVALRLLLGSGYVVGRQSKSTEDTFGTGHGPLDGLPLIAQRGERLEETL